MLQRHRSRPPIDVETTAFRDAFSSRAPVRGPVRGNMKETRAARDPHRVIGRGLVGLHRPGGPFASTHPFPLDAGEGAWLDEDPLDWPGANRSTRRAHARVRAAAGDAGVRASSPPALVSVFGAHFWILRLLASTATLLIASARGLRGAARDQESAARHGRGRTVARRFRRHRSTVRSRTTGHLVLGVVDRGPGHAPLHPR